MPQKSDTSRQQIDPLLQKALSAIGNQGDSTATTRNSLGQMSADGISKSNTDALNRMKDQMMQDAARYGRRGVIYPATQVSTDDQHKLDRLKQDIDARNQGYLDSASRQAAEIQNSARNLQSLSTINQSGGS